MTAKKTQCPFCESIFAVTPEQLLARGGHVRCGKCFQVFKADEHVVLPTPLGVSAAPAHEATASADIFDFLDQPKDEDSDTLAGQPVLPISPASATNASDLGKLEQKTELEPDFDALFAALVPQSIDPNESYAQSAQSKHDDFESDFAPPAPAADHHPLPLNTPLPEHATVAKSPDQQRADSFILDLPSLDQPKSAAQIQDTPPPGSVAAVVLPALGTAASPSSSGSLFNKKQHTSAKLSSLKFDDELSELFLGDNTSPAKKDILKHHDTLSVDKLSKTADESWADALLQEEEASKQAAAEQQADALLGTKKPPSVLKPSSATLNASTAKSTQLIPDQSTHRSMALEEDDLLSYLSQVGAASEKTEERGSARHKKNTEVKPQALPPPASHRIRIPAKTQQATGHHLAWGAMCGLLLLLLLAQGLYFNFSNLGSDPRYNGRLTAICGIVGCQVPSMDLEQIATARVRLQRSPNDSQTTRVSLTLTNQANHSQFLPKMKFLQLSNGNVEAYRLVEPHEYLQGNDRQLKQLLPRQSLKIEFHLNLERSSIKKYAVDPIY